MTAEIETLQKALDIQRGHIAGILEGLSEEQLRRPVLPSGWNCLGLVRHLTLDVEHYWFRCIVGGEALDFFGRPHSSGAWEVGPDESAGDVLDKYQDEIAQANDIIATSALDMAPRQRDPWWGDWDVPNCRFVLLHVVAETACHAGHLDAARELLDGHQWRVL